MKTLNRYIGGGFLLSLLSTLAVITFIMALVSVVRFLERAAGVVDLQIGRVLLLALPGLLTFAIPMSVLTATLLQFGRLSGDGEIVAMRACGTSIDGIIFAPVALSALLTVLCFVINSWLYPITHYEIRKLRGTLRSMALPDLIEENRFIDIIDGTKVCVGSKKGDELRNIIILRRESDGGEVEIRATSGAFSIEADDTLMIRLKDVQIYPRDELAMIQSEHYTIDLGPLPDSGAPRKKRSDLTLPELLREIQKLRPGTPSLDMPEDARSRERMTLVIESHKRVNLALSCLAFVLLGLPLGIKRNRKESSAGLGISLLVFFFYYFFIIFAEAVRGHPELHPDLIIWIPALASVVVGSYLIWRLR